MSSSCHYWEGRIPLAFVFSVPGADEMRSGKPVAGDTGENLESALAHLHSAKPTLFPSVDRYDYRITNAFPEPIAISLGHRASEAKISEVIEPRNIQRVLRELEGCSLVVLCGGKAILLAPAIRDSGRTVVQVPHPGNKGLNRRFHAPSQLLPPARRMHRVKMWANAVLLQACGSPNTV